MWTAYFGLVYFDLCLYAIIIHHAKLFMSYCHVRSMLRVCPKYC